MPPPVSAHDAFADFPADGDGGERPTPAITANLVHAPATQSIRLWVGAIVVLLLVVIPGVLILRAGSGNAAADQLSSLSVPSWAAGSPQTHTSGSRYCVGQCLVTERTWNSTRSVDETAAAYGDAVRKQGWTPATTCPKFPGGVQTCWVLDQNQLDLTVGKAACALAPPPTNVSNVVGDPTSPAKPPAGCSPTSVHAKITDQVNSQPSK